MVTPEFRDLLVAIASSAGALIGLLFVALSVAPREGFSASTTVIRQVRAAAALVSFINPLAVSMFSLVPGAEVGYPATVLGIIGILFTAGGIRTVLSSEPTRIEQGRQVQLAILLLLIFGTELVAGIALIGSPKNGSLIQWVGYALVSSLLLGIARAWELVSNIDTGILSSIAALAGRPSTLDGQAPHPLGDRDPGHGKGRPPAGPGRDGQ